MKKLILFAVVLLSVFSSKAQFHQDSIYFFIKLKNPKASFTINKPGLFNGGHEYQWHFHLNTDNNHCTGYTSFNLGEEISIGLSHTAWDTSGQKTVTLLDKQYFDLRAQKYNPTNNTYFSINVPMEYYLSGDSGVFIVAPKADTNLTSLDSKDSYFVQTFVESSQGSEGETNEFEYFDINNIDDVDDIQYPFLDILYSRIFNTNVNNNNYNYPFWATIKYDSAGVQVPLLKGKAIVYKYIPEDRFIMHDDNVLINNGNINYDFSKQGRYQVYIKPDSILYGTNIIPSYINGELTWPGFNEAFMICKDDTMQKTLVMKRVNMGLSGTNSIQGYLLNGYGPRKPGEPKRGAGVALEQIPGGSVAYKTTDTNGFYNFEGLPSGDYKVKIIIPQSYMISEYTAHFDANGNDIDTAVYFIVGDAIYLEDEKLTIDSAYASFGAEKRISQNVSIYPNPNNGMLFVKCLNSTNSKTSIIINDIYGKEIYNVTSKENFENTPLRINLNQLNIDNGLYLITITQEEKHASGKFIYQRVE